MRVPEFVQVVQRLDPRQPLTDGFDCPPDTSRHRYGSQKDHLLGWMRGYGGPGAYGRRQPGQDARFLYNHLRCAPALLFLAEALGEDRAVLQEGMRAVLTARPNPSTQCAAFRLLVPWERIEELARLSRSAREMRRSAPPVGFAENEGLVGGRVASAAAEPSPPPVRRRPGRLRRPERPSARLSALGR